MNFFDKLLTNKGSIILNEETESQYLYEGTHIGTDAFPENKTFTLYLSYGRFELRTSDVGTILMLEVHPSSYKVGRVVGETIHKWNANTVDLDRSYEVHGLLTLNVRDKGFIWGYIPNGSDEYMMMVTKRSHYDKFRSPFL